jgi:hypothetical protein
MSQETHQLPVGDVLGRGEAPRASLNTEVLTSFSVGGACCFPESRLSTYVLGVAELPRLIRDEAHPGLPGGRQSPRGRRSSASSQARRWRVRKDRTELPREFRQVGISGRATWLPGRGAATGRVPSLGIGLIAQSRFRPAARFSRPRLEDIDRGIGRR